MMSWLSSQYAVWRTVFLIAWQASPLSTVLAVTGWFVTTVVAGPVLAVTLGELAENSSQSHILFVALLALALVIPEVVLQATDAARHYLRERCQLAVDRTILEAHLGVKSADVDADKKYQDCVFFVRTNARKLADTVLIVSGALGLTLGFGVSIATLVSISPLLAVPAAVAAALGSVQIRVSSWVAKAEENLTTSRRLLADLVDTVTAPEHRSMVATTAVAEWSTTLYQQHVEKHRSVLWRTNTIASAANIGMYVIQVAVMAAMIVLAFSLGEQGIITAGQVVAVVTLNQFALESARGLVSNVAQFRQADTLGRKLHTLTTQVATMSALAAGEKPQPGEKTVIEHDKDHRVDQTVDCSGGGGVESTRGLSGPVVLDDVHYTYPGHEMPSLSQFSFTFRPGTVYAIVGSNGAGKSTLAKVLAGLLEVNQGSVTVGPYRLDDVGYSSWRAGVAFTFQNFAKLPFSLKDNVLIGELSTWPRTRDEAGSRTQNLLHHVQGEGVLQAVSGDVNVQLTDDQDGHRLSAGQWQKVAAARTACRTKPFMQIVDEPTSALDPYQEHLAFVNLMQSAKRPGSEDTIHVFITHRYSSARMADHVLLIEDGALSESGTHADLMASSADYRANVERFDALLAAAPSGTRNDH